MRGCHPPTIAPSNLNLVTAGWPRPPRPGMHTSVLRAWHARLKSILRNRPPVVRLGRLRQLASIPPRSPGGPMRGRVRSSSAAFFQHNRIAIINGSLSSCPYHSGSPMDLFSPQMTTRLFPANARTESSKSARRSIDRRLQSIHSGVSNQSNFNTDAPTQSSESR